MTPAKHAPYCLQWPPHSAFETVVIGHANTSGRDVSSQAHRRRPKLFFLLLLTIPWYFRIPQGWKQQRHEAHAALSGANAEVAELQAQLAEMRRREQAAQVGKRVQCR